MVWRKCIENMAELFFLILHKHISDRHIRATKVTSLFCIYFPFHKRTPFEKNELQTNQEFEQTNNELRLEYLKRKKHKQKKNVSMSKEQLYLPGINHCIFRPVRHWEPRNKVGSLSPAEYHYKWFHYHYVMFYENSFAVPPCIPKLREIVHSYLKKLSSKPLCHWSVPSRHRT